MKDINLSVVIPVFNGATTIGDVVDAVTAELSGRLSSEIILVNDGSADNSLEKLRELVRRYPHVSALNLARNFGEHNAVMAGLNASNGEFIAIVDDDMQNPPSELTKLYQEIQNGYDVVFSNYKNKRHHLIRNFGSKFNDLVANIMLRKPPDLYLSSFKIMRSYVAKEVIKYPGPYPYIDGLILSITRNYSQVYVDHLPRAVGRSNYTTTKLVRLWLNMFTNFSILPLRLAIVAGVLSALLGFGFMLYTIVERIQNPEVPLGYAALIVTILFFSGIILMALGMIGEYLGRLFLFVNRKPQFVVKETITHDK